MTLGDLLQVYTPPGGLIKVLTTKADGTTAVHFEGKLPHDLAPYTSREIAYTFFNGTAENRILCIELEGV